MTEVKKIRGFEVVSQYKDKGINLPVRKTKFSAGHDIESAETIVIPSIWNQVFKFIGTLEREIGKEIGSFDEIAGYMNGLIFTSTIEDIMKKFDLRPTLVPTGLRAYMKEDEVLKLVNRSSTPMKKGLMMANNIAIIDKDYYDSDNEGHMYVQYINFLPFDVTINKGDALAQGLFEKYLVTDTDDVSAERNGGIGSTDEDGK